MNSRRDVLYLFFLALAWISSQIQLIIIIAIIILEEKLWIYNICMHMLLCAINNFFLNLWKSLWCNAVLCIVYTCFRKYRACILLYYVDSCILYMQILFVLKMTKLFSNRWIHCKIFIELSLISQNHPNIEDLITNRTLGSIAEYFS